MLHFICGSLLANLHKIKSGLAREQSDSVLVQKPSLCLGKAVKIGGYAMLDWIDQLLGDLTSHCKVE